MMNTVILITDDYSLLNKGINDDNIVISFVINSTEFFENLNLNAVHESSLFKNKNLNFAFHFDLSDKKSNSLIQAFQQQNNSLIQYFFHPKYFCVEDRPAISLEGENLTNPAIKKIIFNLNKQAVEQGFNGIHPIYFTAKKDIQQEHLNIIYSENDDLNNFSAVYYELLSKQYYVAKYIGIKSKTIAGFTDVLYDAEAKLFKDNPDLSKHLYQYCELKKTAEKLNNDIGLVNEDLINQKIYLKIFKDQDESVKINEFYQNEYEVLPLWYKQFGHLIKVLIGKRSWRSLFNNNVKKYKN